MKNEINPSIINGSTVASLVTAGLPEELRHFLMNEAEALVQEVEPVAAPTATSARRGSFNIFIPRGTVRQTHVGGGGKLLPYMAPDGNPTLEHGDAFCRAMIQKYFLHEGIADLLKRGGALLVDLLVNFVAPHADGVAADVFWINVSDLAARTDHAEEYLGCVGGGANVIAVIWEPAFAAASDRAPRMAWCAAYRADVFSFSEGAEIPVSQSDQTKSTHDQIQQDPAESSAHAAELDVPRNL